MNAQDLERRPVKHPIHNNAYPPRRQRRSSHGISNLDELSPAHEEARPYPKQALEERNIHKHLHHGRPSERRGKCNRAVLKSLVRQIPE